jgi:hypothetical protein
MYGTKERCTQVLAGRLKGMRPLGRPSDSLEDNLKMALQEVGLEGIYTGLIWLRIGTGGGRL